MPAIKTAWFPLPPSHLSYAPASVVAMATNAGITKLYMYSTTAMILTGTWLQWFKDVKTALDAVNIEIHVYLPDTTFFDAGASPGHAAYRDGAEWVRQLLITQTTGDSRLFDGIGIATLPGWLAPSATETFLEGAIIATQQMTFEALMYHCQNDFNVAPSPLVPNVSILLPSGLAAKTVRGLAFERWIAATVADVQIRSVSTTSAAIQADISASVANVSAIPGKKSSVTVLPALFASKSALNTQLNAVWAALNPGNPNFTGYSIWDLPTYYGLPA